MPVLPGRCSVKRDHGGPKRVEAQVLAEGIDIECFLKEEDAEDSVDEGEE